MIKDIREKLDTIEKITNPEGISDNDIFFGALLLLGKGLCDVIEDNGEHLHSEAIMKLENGTNILLAKALEEYSS